jgi:CheY-like chemotaxis protein
LRVRQILNNQLSNAIKYTQEGRVSLKIKWTPEEKAGEGRLTIQVTDTGQGIKKEDMGKLFAQYGQINAQANRNIEGTGLGLSITKNLVEMMGGMIQVESKYRRGSVFTAAVRQKAAGKAPLGKEAAQNLKHFRFIESRSIRDKKLISIHVPAGKALVVDDVETNLYVARGLLLPYGLTIDCVKSGQEAIDRIRQEPSYDIVFMDHMMPGMDGIETTGIIRAIPGEYVRSLPIIALTANAIVGMRDMFLGKGFNDYLSKPISRTRLDEILVQWIPRAKQQKPGGAEDAGAAGAAAKTAGVKTAEAAPAQQEELTIEGIDVKQGMVMTGGSAAAYREILAVFCKDAAARLEMLVKAPTEKELLSFTTNVHALKSASANIGAAGASQKAAALEGAAKQKDLGVIEANLDDFRVTLEALLQAIHTSLEPKETDAPGEDPAITDTDRKQLTELREALRAGEIRVMDTLLRALKERRINSRLRQAVASISDCVLLSDFQDAIAIINELPL